MRKVLIMLSTYNGKDYLREQLDSIYQQNNVEIYILVRDDGSIDNTLDILSEYQCRYGRMTIHTDTNIGAAKSFHALMAYAYEEFPDFDYYAFSDQDDVWLEDKIYSAITQLSGKAEAMYYSNALVTDSNLNIIGELGCKKELSLQYLMFRQPALGCTQVLTGKYFRLCADMSKKYLEKKPPFVELHDVFTMWVSQMIGCEVVVDNTPHIMYRQHGNNVTSHKRENIIQKMNRVSKRTRKHRGDTYANLLIIRSLLCKRLTSNSKDVLNKMEEYKKSTFRTLSFAFYMQKYFSKLTIKFMVLYKILNRLY